MLLLTETILFYWDSIDYYYRQDSQAVKGQFEGVMDWAEKLASSKSLHSVLGSQCSSAAGTVTHRAKSISTTGSGKKLRALKATSSTSTSPSTQTSTPAPASTISANVVEDYINGTDEAERPHDMVAQSTARTGWGIVEVVSSSELDECIPPPSQLAPALAHKKQASSGQAPRSKRKMKQEYEVRWPVLCTFAYIECDPPKSTEDQETTNPSKRTKKSVDNGDNRDTWSGMWRSPLVLQTFAAHFNFIQGQKKVVALEKELHGLHGALALACTAIFRVLKYIIDGHILFTQEETKHGIVWSASVEKGSHLEFNETVWGNKTRAYLEPIKALSDESFMLIVKATKTYVKGNASAAASAIDSMEDNSDYGDLFNFC
ncbi:hypothetical protein JVU11DRAFT_5960 [Chiua virens]|nr:hypothetical protein JVU11DRAFT_5960 [Chiua virens]